MEQLYSKIRNSTFSNLVGTRLNGSKLSVSNKNAETAVELDSALKVLIVDRDSMSSNLIADALARDGRCEAAAVPGADLSRTLAASEVDLVVIGAEFPSKRGNGFDLAHSVHQTYRETSIVILLDQTCRGSVIAAFRSGARGVFSRQQPVTDLLDCVQQVGKGFIWAGRQETWYLLEAFRSIPAPSLVAAFDSQTLTTREMQVVRSAAKGKTNKAIAGELGLSEHTIKNYLFKAFEKLGVSSRVELLFYLTVHGHKFDAPNPPSLDADLEVE